MQIYNYTVGGEYTMYDIEKMFFDGRIIFPIVNTKGEVCGASGRRDITKPRQAKYINRGNGFVGNILTEEKTVILTEGNVTVLLAQLQGYDNVLVFAGSYMSDEDIVFFKEKDKNVILFFDQDMAGKKAANKLAERFKNIGVKVFVFEIDTAIDMIEYIMQGNSVENVLKIAK